MGDGIESGVGQIDAVIPERGQSATQLDTAALRSQGELVIWDVETGTIKRCFAGHGSVPSPPMIAACSQAREGDYRRRARTTRGSLGRADGHRCRPREPSISTPRRRERNLRPRVQCRGISVEPTRQCFAQSETHERAAAAVGRGCRRVRLDHRPLPAPGRKPVRHTAARDPSRSYGPPRRSLSQPDRPTNSAMASAATTFPRALQWPSSEKNTRASLAVAASLSG